MHHLLSAARRSIMQGLFAPALLLLFPFSHTNAQVHQHDALPNLDRRADRKSILPGSGAVEQRRASRQRAEQALRARHPHLHLDWDPLLESPKWVANRESFLTGPGQTESGGNAQRAAGAHAEDRHRVIKKFVDDHTDLFGHGSTAFNTARIRQEYVGAHNGLRTVVWQQEHLGIEVFRSVFLAHITRHEELVNISSHFMAHPAAAAEAGRANRAQLTTPSITAAEAVRLAVRHLDEHAPELIEVTTEGAAAESDQRQKFSCPSLKGQASVRLVWLPLDSGTLQLCWEISLEPRDRSELYRVVLDGVTGEVWIRHSLTEYISAASYRVYTGDSPTPFSPGYNSPGNSTQPATVARTLVTLSALNTNASPNGWINDGVNELRGNNVDAYGDRDNNSAADLPRPTGSPSRVFDYPLDLTKSPSNYLSAAIANLFYWNNWVHDKLWELGFTEAAGNFQNNNFGRGGLGNDAVNAEAQDGGGTKNANFSTPVDGSPPRMQMYIWPDPTPARDGDLDAQIIIHEYVHGLSNRRVGGGVLIAELQSRAMGEGWSDFYAHALLSSPGDDLQGVYPLGGYALFDFKSDFPDNYYFGIRRYPLSTRLQVQPLTFKDIDPAQASTHPGVPKSPLNWSPTSTHSIGEVWCAALWEVRANLITKHGFAVGNQLALQLVTDGMGLCPPDPNFIQARDAILQADTVLTGGANRMQIWSGFAKRGLGLQASSPESSSYSGVVESFDLPDDLEITPSAIGVLAGPVGGPLTASGVSFTLKNLGGTSLNWQVFPQAPLSASVSGGNLPAGAQNSLQISVPAAAVAALPAGEYPLSAIFSNQMSGASIVRFIQVRIGGAGSGAVESFAASSTNTFDLNSSRLVFSPIPGKLDYSVCREPIATFVTSTANANTLSLSDDGSELINFLGGKGFTFFGVTYTNVYVSANGFLTFGIKSTAYNPTLSRHFAVPRISGLFTDLNPALGGEISWRQLSDRVAFTWQNIAQFGTTRTNQLQIELFFSGRIGMSYLDCQATNMLVGLSAGFGTPPGFVPIDLSASSACTQLPLVLETPEFLTEGVGTVSSAGDIFLPQALGTNLTIHLSSSDGSEIVIPDSVVIPAGSTTGSFAIAVVDDLIPDGTQASYISATASGFPKVTRLLKVKDNESLNLGLVLNSPATEGGFGGSGTVTLSAPAGDLIAVTLSSANPDQLLIPPTVFIPQGQTSAGFTFMTPEDDLLEGTRLVAITARVDNWPTATANVSLLDNEVAELSMTSTFLLNESMGTVTNGGSVSIRGVAGTDLPVLIVSGDESEVRTPLFGVVIPAGQTNTTFPLFVQDDAILDGPIFVQLRALANGFVPATNLVLVADNDGPPEPFEPDPADGAVRVSVDADLGWGAVDSDLVDNGDFETGDLSGWLREDIGAGGFVVHNGTYNPVSPDHALAPLAGSYSALSDQLGNGRHAIYQDIAIPGGATNVTLQWSDRIRNHAAGYAESQRFRVELWNSTNNMLLATLFDTPAGYPAFNNWSNRTANLNPWRGQTVRLAFAEDDGLGFLNVHLDDISVFARSAAPTFFDVYLGTNNPPGSTDLLGSTTNSSWTLPLLGGGTTYYWQLKSRRGTITNAGPVWSFTTEGSSTTTTYLALGATWKYRNTGQDLGTTWTNLNYNDSIWSSGPGLLGFGGAQTTTIGSAANGYITFYFRQKFNVPDASRVAALTARLVRDDGAIVWINGRQAISSNMPRPPITYLTQAASENTGLFQLVPLTFELDPALLVSGTNIVAVEVHQRHPSGSLSTDLYFDLELKGIVNNGNEAPFVKLNNPPSFAQFASPGNVQLQAGISDDTLLFFGYNVDFYTNGFKLGSDGSSPYSFTWTNPPPGVHTLSAVVTDPGGLMGTSAPVHISVLPSSGTVITLVPPGATWLYNDSDQYPGANWMTSQFRPGSEWSSGRAQFGYGEGDEATVLDYGRYTFDKPISSWFRHTFRNDANLTGLTLRVLRDDGVVVYLNGSETLRNNLPAGPLTKDTPASTTISGAAESAWATAAFSSHILPPGDNLIAVEIHQDSPFSTDHSFDLELTGVGNLRPSVTLTAPGQESRFAAPANVVIGASAFDPYGSLVQVEFFRDGASLGTDSTPPYQLTWTNAPAGVHTLTAVATDNQGATGSSWPIQVTGLAPVTLMARQSGDTLVLSWPTSAPGYRVLRAVSLNPPVTWEELPETPVIVGGEFQIQTELPEVQGFFRLEAP